MVHTIKQHNDNNKRAKYKVGFDISQRVQSIFAIYCKDRQNVATSTNGTINGLIGHIYNCGNSLRKR